MDKGRRDGSVSSSTREWDRDLAEFVYKWITERVDIPKEEWIEASKSWGMWPVRVGDDLAAVFMVNTNEIHVASDPKYRGKWMTRKVIREVMGSMLKEYGQLITVINWGNDAACKYVERLGFVPDNIVYRLDKLTHLRD